jgi:ABC-2 type transport system permease protein
VSDQVVDAVQPAERTARRPSWAGAAWRQFRLERRLYWRNPSAAFFGFLVPLLLLALFGAVIAEDQDQLNVIVPGIAGLSVTASNFVALAYNVTGLREQGILKRLRGTPLPSSAYLTGIGANAVTNTVIQVAIVIVAGRVFFGVPWPRAPLALLVFLAIGVVCFAALGVALSHAIPNMDSAPAYVNVVFLPMMFLAGVFYDEENTPALLRDLAEVLPLTHLVDGVAGAIVAGDGLDEHGRALLALGVWTALGVLLAVRGFSWESRR